MKDRHALIRAAVKKICDETARSVAAYVKTSGADSGDMPEYFMSTYVFKELADKCQFGAMTLETSMSKLCEWDSDSLKRAGGATQASNKIETNLETSGWRVDLVAFNKDSEKKSEQSLLTIVEFKKYRLDEIDSEKVCKILRILKTCRHGAVVGFVEMPASQAYVDEQRKKVEGRIEPNFESFWVESESANANSEAYARGVKFLAFAEVFCRLD